MTRFPSGQVVLFEQYRLFRRTWWIIGLIALLAAVGTFIYVTYYVPKEYRGVAIVVPPNKSGTPLDNLLGGITSSIKDFSLSRLIGGSSGGTGYSNIALVTSLAVKDSLIEKYDLFQRYEIPKDRRDMVYGALDGNMELDVDVEGPITISVYDTDPMLAASMTNDVIHFTNSLSKELNRLETQPITEFMYERYSQVKEKQKELGIELQKFMQENQIYEPESQLSVAATALIEARANEEAQRALVNVLTRTLGADDPSTIAARQMLAELERQSTRMQQGEPGVGPSVSSMPEALVNYMRLRQDYEVNAKTLALLEPMYEQTKFDEVRNIPVLQFLHEAEPPPIKARPKRAVYIASAFLGTLIISYIIFALVAYWRSFTTRYRMYRELESSGSATIVKQGDTL